MYALPSKERYDKCSSVKILVFDVMVFRSPIESYCTR